MSNKSWYDFEIKARAILRQTPPVDKKNGFISILYMPSFDNEFLLQFSLGEPYCNWQRWIWDKSSDFPKFGVIESLKYIGQEIDPAIIHEQGAVPRSTLKDVIEYIDNLKTSFLLQKNQHIVLDGAFTSIAFGNDNWEVTFNWTILPEELRMVNKLAGMMLNINEQLSEQ